MYDKAAGREIWGDCGKNSCGIDFSNREDFADFLSEGICRNLFHEIAAVLAICRSAHGNHPPEESHSPGLGVWVAVLRYGCGLAERKSIGGLPTASSFRRTTSKTRP